MSSARCWGEPTTGIEQAEMQPSPNVNSSSMAHVHFRVFGLLLSLLQWSASVQRILMRRAEWRAKFQLLEHDMLRASSMPHDIVRLASLRLLLWLGLGQQCLLFGFSLRKDGRSRASRIQRIYFVSASGKEEESQIQKETHWTTTSVTAIVLGVCTELTLSAHRETRRVPVYCRNDLSLHPLGSA